MIRIDPAKLNGSQTKFFLRGDKISDASPSARTVTNTGTVTVATVSDSQFDFTKAYSGSTSGQYLTVDVSSNHLNYNKDFTIHGWCKLGAGATSGYLYRHGTDGSYGPYLWLYLNPGGNVYSDIYYYSGSLIRRSTWVTTSAPTKGVYYHYASVFYNGAYTFYLNGISQTQNAATYNGNIAYPPGNVENGMFDASSQWLGLKFDQYAIWKGKFKPPRRY
jgi:hypothetical protein